MKYETPQLTELTPAINAIQSEGPQTSKIAPPVADSFDNESVSAYQDWE